MQKYIARRLILMVPTLVILSLLVFALMRVLPGDVAQMILAEGEGGLSKSQNEQALATLRKELGLDKPLHIQYVVWMGDFITGDLGKSLLSGQSVASNLLIRLPVTAQLALMGMLFGMAVGIPLGILSALRPNSVLDLVLRVFSIIFLTAPTFWLGLLVILGGMVWFNYIPPLGYYPVWENPIANLLQLIWPAAILGSHGMATMARMTRSSMLEVMREDYIRTARAKGLQEQVVVVRHALKNALMPVVTLAGITFGHLMGGTVILEYIFGIPGMGSWWITSIQVQDYPVSQSLIMVFGAWFMLVNLGVDLMYGWLDPRISYS